MITQKKSKQMCKVALDSLNWTVPGQLNIFNYLLIIVGCYFFAHVIKLLKLIMSYKVGLMIGCNAIPSYLIDVITHIHFMIS